MACTVAVTPIVDVAPWRTRLARADVRSSATGTADDEAAQRAAAAAGVPVAAAGGTAGGRAGSGMSKAESVASADALTASWKRLFQDWSRNANMEDNLREVPFFRTPCPSCQGPNRRQEILRGVVLRERRSL